MYKQVYQNSGETFYIGCEWTKKKVDLDSCNLQNSFPKGQMKRAKRTEAEHVIPASWMYKKDGQFRQCYKDAKAVKQRPRDYCQEHDIDYRNAHNDLVNLRPAVGQINADRSNKPFLSSTSGESLATFRNGDKKISIASRGIVPDPSTVGDIARIAFYMADKYGVTYSKRQLDVFNKWNRQDPVSGEERVLNKRIQQAQGVENHYVK